MLKLFGRKISSWQLVLLAGDTGVYILAVILAFLLNPILHWHWSFFLDYLPEILLIWFTYIVVIYIADLYDYQQDFRRWPAIARLIATSLAGMVVIIVLYFFPLGTFIGRWQIIIQTGCFVSLLVVWRWMFSALALPRRLKRTVLIIGAGKSGRRLLEAIRRRRNSGLEVVGFIDDDPRKIGTEIDGVLVLGNCQTIGENIAAFHVKLLIIAITHEKSQALVQALTKLCWNGCQVFDMPSFYEYLAGKIPIEHISDIWLFLNSLRSRKFYYRRLKRLVDLVLAVFTLLITSPLFLLSALMIKLDSPGPVFYLQERLGQDGKTFRIIKFRTMVQDAESQGPQWAAENDSRITRVGGILRKFRLDELPQLFNVIKGEMSIVGPRPEREIFVQEFIEPVLICRQAQYSLAAMPIVIDEIKERVPYYSYRLLVKPGITGWAQVQFTYASSMEDTWEKLKFDLYYIKNICFLLDLAILLKTVRIVLFGRGR